MPAHRTRSSEPRRRRDHRTDQDVFRRAALAGVAPTTQGLRTLPRRHLPVGCNKRLRQAITTFASNSRRSSPWAAGIYQQARDRGINHPHAVRVLARAWTRVIYRCWLDEVPTNPVGCGNPV
jgi:hypothetical protein